MNRAKCISRSGLNRGGVPDKNGRETGSTEDHEKCSGKGKDRKSRNWFTETFRRDPLGVWEGLIRGSDVRQLKKG